MRARLAALSPRTVAILVALASFAAAGAWYALAYQPLRADLAATRSEIAVLRADVARAERARTRLPQVQAEIEALDTARAAFLAQLPRESDVADLLVALRRSADASGVRLTRLAQGGVRADVQPDVRAIAFDVASEGTYAATMAFLGELERLERFTRVDRVAVRSGAAAADPTLDASFGVTVFVYTGPAADANAGVPADARAEATP